MLKKYVLHLLLFICVAMGVYLIFQMVFDPDFLAKAIGLRH